MWCLPETIRDLEESGHASVVRELIDCFQNDISKRIERLHDAVAQMDAGTVRAEAHSVRGSAMQMGAETLADLCQAIEAGAPQKVWPELEYHVNQADAHFAEVLVAMAEYLNGKRRDE